jgi:hypothetical protein
MTSLSNNEILNHNKKLPDLVTGVKKSTILIILFIYLYRVSQVLPPARLNLLKN